MLTASLKNLVFIYFKKNLEGWKSSRRKRQEHVIERVTEVKRMEQEEALKASEAAAKRLIGIRLVFIKVKVFSVLLSILSSRQTGKEMCPNRFFLKESYFPPLSLKKLVFPHLFFQ